MIPYNYVHGIMQSLGVRDYKIPKGQQAISHLDYNSLDYKSIRLVNRLIHYLGSSGT